MSIFLRLFQVSCIVVGLSTIPLAVQAMQKDPLWETNPSESETIQTIRRPHSNSDLPPISPEKFPFFRKTSAQEPRGTIYIEIIEDNKLNQVVLTGYINSFIQNFLVREGMNDLIKVIVASDAEEGIAYWNRYNPRVIFLDSHLGPGRSGKDILKERIEFCSSFVLNDLEKQALTVSQDKLESELLIDKECLTAISHNKNGKKNHRQSRIDNAWMRVKASEENLQTLINLKKRQIRVAKKNRFGISLGNVVCISTDTKDNCEMIDMGAQTMCPKPHKRDAVFTVLRQMF